MRPPAASLTGAAEALLPQADQHVEAQVAVGRLVEVLQPPHVLPVVLHVLQVGGQKHNNVDKLTTRPSELLLFRREGSEALFIHKNTPREYFLLRWLDKCFHLVDKICNLPEIIHCIQ